MLILLFMAPEVYQLTSVKKILMLIENRMNTRIGRKTKKEMPLTCLLIVWAKYSQKGVYPDKNTPKLILVSKEAQFYTDLPKKILKCPLLGKRSYRIFGKGGYFQKIAHFS